MTQTLQQRSIGSKGIITDYEPSDLPLGAWSGGSNVAFKNGRVRRSPVFKMVSAFQSNDGPVSLLTYRPYTAVQDQLYAATQSGKIYRIPYGGDWADADDPAAPKASSKSVRTTTTYLSEVVYVNRPDVGIRGLLPTSTNFAMLPNKDSEWTCDVLRGYQSLLIALSVTKAGAKYPNLVKWSNLALAGKFPSDWDATQEKNPSTMAGENPLADMATPIMDGLSLKNDFLIYGQSEIWAATFTGDGTYPLAFRKLFGDQGALAANCVCEVEGLHYVFAANSIYRHDGATIDPLKGVSDYVFREKYKGDGDPAFVSYDARNEVVRFCYKTTEATGAFCNKAAVYAYRDGTWSFVDLPNSSAEAYGSISQAPDWQALPGTTWQDDLNAGLAWDSDVPAFKPIALAASVDPLRESKSYVLAYDQISGGDYSGEIVEALNGSPWLVRDGITFSSPEGTIPVTQVKQYHRFLPIVVMPDTSKAITFTLGGTYLNGQAASWGPAMPFNPATQYHLDSRMNGRFLSLRMDSPTVAAFEWSGFDLDFTLSGGR